MHFCQCFSSEPECILETGSLMDAQLMISKLQVTGLEAVNPGEIRDQTDY